MKNNSVSRTMRIAFHNIHSGVDEYGSSNISPLAAWVSSNNIDVLALAEIEGIYCNSTVDWLEQLKQLTGMAYHAYGECLSFDVTADSHGTFGNGLISRIPIRRAENRIITPPNINWDGQTPETEERNVLLVELDDTDHLSVFVTHFPYGDVAELREYATKSLVEMMDESEPPILVCGDFNAEIDDCELAALRNYPLMKFRAEKVPTYPTQQPSREIDYIVISSDISLRRYYVDGNADFSDHLPIVVEINR